jgi:hypothetical protein
MVGWLTAFDYSRQVWQVDSLSPQLCFPKVSSLAATRPPWGVWPSRILFLPAMTGLLVARACKPVGHRSESQGWQLI